MAVNRLITYFVGEDVSMKSTMNEINGSLTNTGRRLDELGRRGGQSVSMLSREFDRFRRHFGYATAGLATYEIFNAIGKLRDYQTELAQVNAVLGETPGQLQEFGQTAIDISNKTAQPLNDVLQSMQNIAQSIPNMSEAARRHLIPTMALIEAMGSRVAGTDPRSFGSTVLGLATAFYGRQAVGGPRGGNILESIARRLVQTQFMTPRVTGQDIATYIPMLAGGAVTSGFTLNQMLALFTVAQRQIQRPATTAQYLRQLMIRLHQPTKAEQPFFAQAGLNPTTLAGLNRSGGGMQILQTLLLHALSMQGNDLGGRTPEQFLRNPSWRRTTLGPAATEFIQNTIGGRIQSLVAARALTAGLGQIPIAENALNNAPSLQSRFGNMNLSMQLASTALSNMATDIGTTFLPAIDVGSTALQKVAHVVDRGAATLNRARNYLDQQHVTGVHGVDRRLGGAAEIAALVAGGLGIRALRRRGLGRLLGRATTGPLAAEQGLLTTEAASNALADQARGTPSAPFWVVIHPLSRTQVPELFGKGLPGPGGGSGTEEKLVRDWFGFKAITGAGKRLATRLGRTGLARVFKNPAYDFAWMGEEAPSLATRVGLRGLPLAGPAYQFFQTGNTRSFVHAGRGMTHLQLGGGYERNVAANSLTALFMHSMGGSIPRGIQPYLVRYAQGKISQQHFEEIIANYVNRNRPRSGQNLTHVQAAIAGMFRMGPGHQLRLSHVDRRNAANGYVEATLTLQPTEEFKNLLRPQQVRVHIPVGDLPAPTSRARTRVPRRG